MNLPQQRRFGRRTLAIVGGISAPEVSVFSVKGSSAPLLGDGGQILQVTLWGVLILCIIRLWLMPLSSSFWVDEAATAFFVHHGATDPSLAVAPQVPASIYYALPKAAERVFGFSEAVYRLPSLLVMLAGLCVIERIGSA